MYEHGLISSVAVYSYYPYPPFSCFRPSAHFTTKIRKGGVKSCYCCAMGLVVVSGLEKSLITSMYLKRVGG